DRVKITGVGGTLAANSTDAKPFWTITVIDQDQFSLNQSDGTASGAFVSGGIWTIDNSSFDTATALGLLGNSGKTVSGTISPALDPSLLYSIQMPGAGDAPGERNIPFEGHTTTVPGRLPDPTSGLKTLTYDFQSVYGFTPQGQKFFNSITEPQKQRAREAMELWARYLGVQFEEVDASVIADMTIATGDPRAIAPTIS